LRNQKAENMKKHIENIEALEQELRAVVDPSGHVRDAITRCVTLKRSLNQHLEQVAAAAGVVAEVKAGLKAAAGKP
jgi:hypothetical protein